MTRVLITTFGTRGDIQPFIALGKGLKAAGFDVAICTSEGFQSFVEEYELHYLVMDNELLRLTQAVLGESAGLGKTMNTASQMIPAMKQAMLDEWNAAQNFQPDVIVYHPKCFGSIHIAEKLRIPAILSLPLPLFTPTESFPVPFIPNHPFGKRFNRFSYRLLLLGPNAMYGGMIDRYRVQTLGLPAQGRFANWLIREDGTPVTVLYPYSPSVLPVPPDFPAHVHVTGYWFLDSNAHWTPDDNLVSFLESDTAPVYVGFGSMGGRKGESRAKIVLEALAKADQRGVLVSGWGGLKAADLPANVRLLDSVPHDWLFPRVAAVVHHGGAGTTAAGLRAGKPTVICPFMADQPFWGKVVHERGAGTEPIPQNSLTAENLASAIRSAVQDPIIKVRAADLGAKIRAEDGITNAVRVIGEVVGKN